MTITTINKSVQSLCPICLKVVKAHIFEDGGSIKIEKKCEVHGVFSDIYWSDSELYRKFDRYWNSGNGLDNPNTHVDSGCPFDCGICPNHKTGTLLGNIDLTNRCNMACPVCFANAEVSGHLYEPTLDQIRRMMETLRHEQPVPCPAVQFSGGEPTMREDLPQIIAMAHDMGFSQVQIATNGIKLGGSLELCKILRRSGLHTVYLQFDGVTPEPYKILRGRNILPVKHQAIENCRRSGLMSVVLVPTLERGVNDGQMGDIVRFAAENLDVIKGVNVQPVSFVGRIDQNERADRRITIPDVLSLLEEQTDNEITREDFYPIPIVAPISHLVERYTGLPQVVFTVHPHCGAATYVYCCDGKLVPITRFIDVEGLFELISDVAANFYGSNLERLRMYSKVNKELPRFIDNSRTPYDLNITRMLRSILKNGTRESLREFHNKILFLGTMHFQDLYNIDLERVQRCGIHYATPDGRIIPFCTYNTIHRQEMIEKYDSQALDPHM
jgi:hypothetical protein